MTRAVLSVSPPSDGRVRIGRGWRACGPSPSTIRSCAEWGAAILSLALAALLLDRPYEEGVLVTAVAVSALVVWIVVQDVWTFTIADGAIAALSLLAVALRRSGGDDALTLALDVLLTGGVLLAFREIYFRRRGVDGLGLGDVKLAAAGGLLVGAVAFAWALLAASLIAIGTVVTVRLVARAQRRGASFGDTGRLAFGAFLAPALLAVFLAQQLPVLLLAVGR